MMIEALWDKRRILEVYLNVVEWGNGIFGCEAAAQRYYCIPAAQLAPGPGRPAGGDAAQPAQVREELRPPAWPPTPRASRAACSTPSVP